MTEILIVADDFSGAAETAERFAATGLETRIELGPTGAAWQAGVRVVDAHTRHLGPRAAAAAVRAILDDVLSARSPAEVGGPVLLKKIDSLWRGNIAAELSAFTQMGCDVVVAGCLPHLGRSVVDGVPRVEGRPLAEADLWAAEKETPPRHLRDLFAVDTGVEFVPLVELRGGSLARLLRRPADGGPHIVVVDGESEGDLAAVVDAVAGLGFSSGRRPLVLAGSGGLAAAVAARLGPDATSNSTAQNAQPATAGASGAGDDVEPSAGGILTVVGSATQAARRQVHRLVTGARVVEHRVAPGDLTLPERRVAVAASLRRDLERARAVALALDEAPIEPGRAADIVRGLADIAASALGDAFPPPGLVLTGGETARTVLDRLGIRRLRPLSAVQPGAVVSQADNGIMIATKPGSFGDDDVLLQLHRQVRAARTAHTSDPRPSTTSGASMKNTAADPRPFIAVTMGDAAGVGPEVTVGALLDPAAYRNGRPVVIGDVGRLGRAADALGVTARIVEVAEVGKAVFETGTINVIDPHLVPEDLPWGQESAVAGDAAYHYIRIACELGMAGAVQGICTAPLNKAALHRAGHVYPGHTELLAHFMGVEEVSMMLSTPKVKVIHVTTHIGLIDAIARVEPGLVERTIRRGHHAMQRAGIATPRIGVCAINPHAGENGLFGHGEEAEKITPGIEAARADGIDARGPLPADTAFFLAGRGDYDLIVAMYHDQGHGPVKVLGIEAGVNITAGLPVIRTSVDHGTAFDIAGTGVVEVGSMIEALRQAVEMSPSPVRADAVAPAHLR